MKEWWREKEKKEKKWGEKARENSRREIRGVFVTWRGGGV